MSMFWDKCAIKTNLLLVGTAISQMDGVTQQNAALVEEASAAASSLDDQAQSLVRSVSVFKIGVQSAPYASAAPLRPISRPPAPNPKLKRASALPTSPKPELRTAPNTAGVAVSDSDANGDWSSF